MMIWTISRKNIFHPFTSPRDNLQSSVHECLTTTRVEQSSVQIEIKSRVCSTTSLDKNKLLTERAVSFAIHNNMKDLSLNI